MEVTCDFLTVMSDLPLNIEQVLYSYLFIKFRNFICIFILFNMCTKKSHAVPVDNTRAFRPSLIKSLPGRL